MQLLQDSRSTQGPLEVVGSVFHGHTIAFSPHVAAAPGHFASETLLSTLASPVCAMCLDSTSCFTRCTYLADSERTFFCFWFRKFLHPLSNKVGSINHKDFGLVTYTVLWQNVLKVACKWSQKTTYSSYLSKLPAAASLFTPAVDPSVTNSDCQSFIITFYFPTDSPCSNTVNTSLGKDI